MRITGLKRETVDARSRWSGTVTWEDTPRPPVEVYFEVPREFGDAFPDHANAFLVAAVIPAMEIGERRISIDGEICLRLTSGLAVVQRLFQTWYGANRTVAIEARSTTRHVQRKTRTGAFFTGGIDSLATLRRNRLVFPQGHPDFVRDLVLLYGINFDSDDSPETFSTAVRDLSAVAEEASATLVPIYTNVRRELNPDLELFRFKYHGALLASAAHALAGRLTTMLVASTHDIPDLMPWGSHPLIDPQFSSVDMRIHHDCLDLSRLDKTKLIVDWNAAVQNIKVCTSNWPGRNCSQCEKCLRTMLALAALGALDRSPAFDGSKLSAAAVRSIDLSTHNQASFYDQLVEPLRNAGRDALAAAVETILARYYGYLGVRGRLRRIDRAYLGGGLTALKAGLAKTLCGDSMSSPMRSRSVAARRGGYSSKHA